MQLDYVLYFSQEPVEREFYTNITKYIEVKSNTVWVIKFKKNIYSQRQEGRVWNKVLVEKLTSSELRLRQSNIYECVLYWVKSMYILYTDDHILAVDPV